MGVYPRIYNIETFNEFLLKNNVDAEIIDKFNSLPDKVVYKGNTFELYINLTWYSVGNTFYNFELNYYCDDKIEFLFNSKVYNDVELSIDNLILELKKIKYRTKK